MELPFPPSPRKADVFRVGPKPKTLKFGIDYHHRDDSQVVLHPRQAFIAAQANPAPPPPQSMRRKMLRVRSGPGNRVTSR